MQLPVSKFYDEHHFGESQIHAISYLSPYEYLVDIVKNNSLQILKGLDVSAHSTDIRSEIPLFSKKSKKVEKPGIDGYIFTNLKKTHHKAGLLVGTADCTPLTFASKDGNTMGIIHIGWKGLFYGIIENLQNEIQKKGLSLSDIQIWIGPMAGEGYEFGRQDYKEKMLPFLEKKSIYGDIGYKEISEDTVSFNFKLLVKESLIQQGFSLENIIFSKKDTLDINETLPSWRKDRTQRRMTTLVYYSPINHTTGVSEDDILINISRQ